LLTAKNFSPRWGSGKGAPLPPFALFRVCTVRSTRSASLLTGGAGSSNGSLRGSRAIDGWQRTSRPPSTPHAPSSTPHPSCCSCVGSLVLHDFRNRLLGELISRLGEPRVQSKARNISSVFFCPSWDVSRRPAAASCSRVQPFLSAPQVGAADAPRRSGRQTVRRSVSPLSTRRAAG
jgi:hypothetical protein